MGGAAAAPLRIPPFGPRPAATPPRTGESGRPEERVRRGRGWPRIDAESGLMPSRGKPARTPDLAPAWPPGPDLIFPLFISDLSHHSRNLAPLLGPPFCA